jgi:hypothetical protein
MHDVLEGIMPKLTSCLLHTIVSFMYIISNLSSNK